MEDFYIRAIEPEDYLYTYQWRKNPGDWDLLVGMKRYVSLSTERKWAEKSVENHEKGNVFRFMICNPDGVPLGMMSVVSVDYHNRSCALSSLIGERQARGKGLIGKVRELVMRYMFEEVGMERIWSRVLYDNSASRRAVEKFGFKQEGVLRNAVFKNNEYKDLVIYSMLKSEFIETYNA